jgi:hypothetical protein
MREIVRSGPLKALSVIALLLTGCTSSLTPARVGTDHGVAPSSVSQTAVDSPDLQNLLHDASFESPIVPPGGFTVFSSGQKFSKWTVVGTSDDIAIVSGTFSQNGFTFPAGCGKQWVDLTGVGTTGAGVAQTIPTVQGSKHALSFSVGNVVDPHGIFGVTSTVIVLVNGVQKFSATNKKGKGKTVQVWQRFTTTIVAPSNSTTITLVNGDPAGDDNNGLDCVKFT